MSNQAHCPLTKLNGDSLGDKRELSSSKNLLPEGSLQHFCLFCDDLVILSGMRGLL